MNRKKFGGKLIQSFTPGTTGQTATGGNLGGKMGQPGNNSFQNNSQFNGQFMYDNK